MICPHCSTAVKYPWSKTHVFSTDENNTVGKEILHAICPNCEEVVIFLQKGKLEHSSYGGLFIAEVDWQKMVYPKETRFSNTEDIPPIYFSDYEEALKVLSASPKASAALSRRLLQNILREEFKIDEKSLSQEIQKFIELDGIPSHLTDAVDAIRNIGNFAAHPLKDKSTGQIVPVENGEAEWLIEVIEALFDFTFIQPLKLKRRREELNLKLERLGKPPMKKKE